MSVVREPNEPDAERRSDERTAADPGAARTLLEVADLYVEFDTYGGVVKAVRGASFDVKAGKTLAIVGESGCGKSVTVQSIMGLIPMPPGRITGGTALLEGVDILNRKIIGGEDVRGNRVGMIFQDPMSSLNPTMTVGAQIAETLEVHRGYSRAKAHARAVELLALTQIPEPEKRARQYPFAFSGGMLQRAMIAMAIACEPDVLIADEPTTALDVTIQAQILDLLEALQRKNGMAIVLITHDLGVVARMADEVAVMYAGEIVERGAVDDVFYRPAHPYALGLKAAMPSNSTTKEQGLAPIEGSPPDLFHPPAGCAYFARCPYAMRLCEPNHPPRFDVGEGHYSRCWLHHPNAPRRVAELYVPASLGETAYDAAGGSAPEGRIARETADE
jgi:oligopeptide/dipeptide ABC transporter ATP-binding protein